MAVIVRGQGVCRMAQKIINVDDLEDDPVVPVHKMTGTPEPPPSAPSQPKPKRKVRQAPPLSAKALELIERLKKDDSDDDSWNDPLGQLYVMLHKGSITPRLAMIILIDQLMKEKRNETVSDSTPAPVVPDSE
jgi:hypothetical protein